MTTNTIPNTLKIKHGPQAVDWLIDLVRRAFGGEKS